MKKLRRSVALHIANNLQQNKEIIDVLFNFKLTLRCLICMVNIFKCEFEVFSN